MKEKVDVPLNPNEIYNQLMLPLMRFLKLPDTEK